ncbi:MAG: DUF2769 domain-containing protein [Candidatus Bathyarchaeota archaeon]|nr:DUF2769 domain-containing protein [Candidatus Bathyarchaeota archaeon]MDH5732840.1 DUF2769 domain-containing protein [Candidatus Bathyarchaeota archaeon]
MDKWEEMMKKIMAMPAEERMKRIELSKSMCICRSCPSYRGTGETELLFCGTGKSTIISKEMGCSCGLCPVVAHMGLTRLYYCTRDTEAEQRGVKI